jgi:hypothetical protein
LLPRNIKLSWPVAKVEMKMKLDGLRVGAIDPQRGTDLFDRRNLANIQSYNLARGLGKTEEPLQRTGGPLR